MDSRWHHSPQQALLLPFPLPTYLTYQISYLEICLCSPIPSILFNLSSKDLTASKPGPSDSSLNLVSSDCMISLSANSFSLTGTAWSLYIFHDSFFASSIPLIDCL